MTSKIIIADEEKDIRFLIRIYLRDYQVDILEAINGEECLNIARRERPQLIIMNYMLDKVTGYQAASVINDDPDLKGLPVILMTLEGFDLSEESSGVSDYLGKPFSRNLFISTLEKVLGNNMFKKHEEEVAERPENKSVDGKSGGADDSGAKKKILVADDEPDIIQLITMILGKDYELDTVATGEELVDKALANKYDLIISDVVMPKMSGWKSIARLREEGCSLPVIFNSGLVKDKDLYETLKPQGVSSFLLKPFKKQELLNRVEEIIGK